MNIKSLWNHNNLNRVVTKRTKVQVLGEFTLLLSRKEVSFRLDLQWWKNSKIFIEDEWTHNRLYIEENSNLTELEKSKIAKLKKFQQILDLHHIKSTLTLAQTNINRILTLIIGTIRAVNLKNQNNPARTKSQNPQAPSHHQIRSPAHLLTKNSHQVKKAIVRVRAKILNSLDYKRIN